MAKKQTVKKVAFVNPFEQGVKYIDFLKAIPSGKTVEEYVKGKLTDDQIDWLSREIKYFKQKKQ